MHKRLHRIHVLYLPKIGTCKCPHFLCTCQYFLSSSEGTSVSTYITVSIEVHNIREVSSYKKQASVHKHL